MITTTTTLLDIWIRQLGTATT